MKDVMGTIACRIDTMFVRIGLGVVLHPVLSGWLGVCGVRTCLVWGFGRARA